MATEPTLGGRILDAANAYAAAISEQVVALDRGTWEVAHADAVTEAMDRLRAPAARVDAAERLAVALVELFECNTDDGDLMREVREEYNEALAAWRALGEVGDARE